MKGSRLIKVLSSLNRKEMTQFLEFSSASYSGASPAAFKLLRYLESCYPAFSEDQISKETVFKSLYPKTKFKKQRILSLSSDLMSCLRDFLSLLEAQQESTAAQLRFLRQLRKRQLSGSHEIAVKQLQKQFSNEKYLAVRTALDKYLLQQELMAQYISEDRRNIDDRLQKISDTLDEFYLSRKMALAVEMKGFERFFGLQFDYGLLPQVQLYVKEHFSDLKVLRINQLQMLCLEQESDASHYYEMRALMDEMAEKLENPIRRMQYRFAQNYCIRKINAGDLDFLRESFDIYKKLLDTNLIFEEGVLAPSDYKNIISASLRLGETSWALDFIESYKEKLPKSSRANTYRLNLAHYYFQTNDHHAASGLLKDAEFTNVFEVIQAKYILLKISFEAGDFELFEFQLIAFNRYVSRNKELGSSIKQSISNFIRAAKRLARFKRKQFVMTKAEMELERSKLKAYFESLNPLTNPQWLMAKLTDA